MLVDTFLATVERHAGRPAVADPTTELTYGQLALLAGVLRRQVESASGNDRVGIMMPSSVGFVGALYGALWAGRTAVPLNFLLQPAELRAVIQDSGIDTIFSVRHFEKALAGLPLKTVYLEDLPIRQEMAALHAAQLPPAPPARPDELAVLLYTSGTSGLPKGVMLSHRNLSSNADDCVRAAKLEADHRFLGVLPLFHIFGLTAMINAPIRAGASVYYMPRFSPGTLIRAIRERRSSVLMIVASIYTAMLRARDAGREDLRSLVYAISGGEALPMRTFEQFREKFGIEILQGYGMTETSAVVSFNMPWQHRVGSVGRPIPNVEVAAFDDDSRRLPAGATGELWVRGPGVMQGYYHKPAESAAAFGPDGWLRTGDAGHVDAEGYIWITGRKKEMIIVGGENVFPREIEAVLEEHAAVAEAAVIGQRDPTRGETVVAFVCCKEGATVSETELREFCRDRLASYKLPRRVIISSDLPRGPTGKILKRKLEELLPNA